MPGSYTADEQSAAKLAGLIADSPTKLTAGVGGPANSTTVTATMVVTHTLGSAPDFVLASRDKADAAALSWASTATNITFTTTAATSYTISYIAGYTA